MLDYKKLDKEFKQILKSFDKDFLRKWFEKNKKASSKPKNKALNKAPEDANCFIMEWKLLNKEKPKHKDLVLCWNGNITVPAIYLDNQSFNGFWFFTTFYSEYSPTIYTKLKLKEKHKINDVEKWRLMDEPKSNGNEK